MNQSIICNRITDCISAHAPVAQKTHDIESTDVANPFPKGQPGADTMQETANPLADAQDPVYADTAADGDDT